MRVALFGHQGKVGSVLAPALEAAGLEVRGIGPSEKRFLAAVERVNPELAKAA